MDSVQLRENWKDLIYMIPYGQQHIDQSDIDAVEKILRSDFLTQGPTVPAFEDAIKKYCDVKYAVAVNSATSALHIACLALEVGPGDSVWTTPITFVASANCALYCGASVEFVDIDPLTYNLSVEKLAEKLSRAEQFGKLPKIVIPVHLSGQSCDMEGIYNLSQKYGFKVIEDASHAIGGRYLDKSIGNCRFSDVTVFSFHPVKIITTGEGGMAVTNDLNIAKKMRLFRGHGITRDAQDMLHTSHGPWYYEQIDLGFNYRMTDIQAALGLSQMQRLDMFVEQRHAVANKYTDLLDKMPIKTPYQSAKSYSSYHLYILQIDSALNDHLEFFKAMRSNGVGVNLHYIPIYRQPYYEKIGFSSSDYPEAEKYYSQAVSLPIFPGLTKMQQEYIANAVHKSLEKSKLN